MHRHCTKQKDAPLLEPLWTLPLSMTRRIPDDIEAMIIDHLHHDAGVNPSLSLVSRTWLHFSRRALLRRMKIVEEDSAMLETLLNSPLCTISQGATGIAMPPNEGQKDECTPTPITSPDYPRLSSFLTTSRFQRLDLDGRSPLLCITGNKITFLSSAVSPNLTALTALTLRSTKFACITELAALLENTPALRHLELIEVYWCQLREYDVTPPPSGILVERLRTLRMRSMSVDSLVEWLLLGERQLRLTRLDLGMAARKTCTDICLRLNREALETLCVYAFPDDYDVAGFSNLKSLEVSIRGPDECQQALSVLRRVTSPYITNIQYNVHTRFFQSSPDFFSKFNWLELEGILGGERFRWLKTLEFSFDTGYEGGVDELKERLPLTHERGIVYVSEMPVNLE